MVATLKERIENKQQPINLLALGLAILALILAAWGSFRPSPTPDGRIGASDASLTSVLSRGVLRAGYGLFPPYTFDDPAEKDQSARIKGFSVDLIRELAARAAPPLKVELFPFSWDSLRPEVLSGKFDLIIDPVFQTIPRAADFRLIRPYSYFGIAVALVRKNDDRFSNFLDLDRPDITIALAEGWTSSEFARHHLSKPKFKSIPVTGDALTQLDEVRLGRADVALNDVPTVTQYARAHADSVKALWLDRPPSSVPGGFLVRADARSLGDFLDTSIEVFIADGTLTRLDAKWKTYGAIPVISARPGAGLSK